jgi:hypothetical protein
MDGRWEMAQRKRTESFLLVVDPLPLRLRGFAATELPVTAAAVADVAGALGARAAMLGRIAYVLAEHDWDISVSGGFMLEARRHCRRVEVERIFAAHPELATYANVYLEESLTDTGRQRQQELFWAEDESRLVMV